MQNHIESDPYHCFVFASPIPIPASIGLHTWLVVVDRGQIVRWEVFETKGRSPSSWGHVYHSLLPPTTGMPVFPRRGGRRWPSRLLAGVQGAHGSLAQRMVRWTNENAPDYPLKDHYHYAPGPNSNTFIQWVLDHFPEAGIRLPWNAWGKGFAKHLKR